MSKFWSGLLLCLFSTAVPAANETPAYPKELTNVGQARDGQALVIGSLTYLKNGRVAECGALFEECRIVVLPPVGRTTIGYHFKQSGAFSWSLPPGEYTIIALDRGDNSYFFRKAFSVPPNTKLTYVGDLRIEIAGGEFRVGVADTYDEAFEGRSGHGFAVKQLIRDEDELGSSNELAHICSATWGLTCSWKRLGVEPLLPHKPDSLDLSVSSLRPMFRWNPVATPGVTYDFALFEGVSYKKTLLSKQYTVGRLVHYAEGISEPMWQPAEPLDPDRKYFWSVRLRRGETVSSWSRYSYSLFSGLRPSMVYGEYLRVDTPSELTK